LRFRQTLGVTRCFRFTQMVLPKLPRSKFSPTT
jgi:hypothetical protein